MSTHFPTKAGAQSDRKWWLVDATDMVLGRLASEVAKVLAGKHRPDWTPFIDTGDHVVLVNAEKVVMTGRKLDQVVKRRHSGYPGGLTEATAREVLQRDPVRLVEGAVFGMLPKNRLGRSMRRKLKVYAGPEHPHEAQQPESTDFGLSRHEPR